MSIELRGDTWHYSFMIDGQRYRGTTGIKGKDGKKEAERIAQEQETRIRGNYSVDIIWEQTKRRMLAAAEVPLDFEKIWELFLQQTMCTAGDRRQTLYRSHIRTFLDWIAVTHPAIKNMSAITSDLAAEFFVFLQNQPGANSTKNDKLATLKMLFEALGRKHGIIENPFNGIKKFTAEKISREIFTPEELKLIGEKATGWIYDLCLTALSTGLREGDICLLKKSSVDLQSGWISIPRINKTGKQLEIPILPALAHHLASKIQESPDDEYVFPELAKKYTVNPSYIGYNIKRFFDEIGIADTQKTIPGYSRQLSAKDIHSFRHTFVYLAALNNIPFPIVQSIVGHASPAMTKIYMDHSRRQDKARAFQQLPQYLQGEKKNPDTRQKPDIRIRLQRLVSNLTSENLERNRSRLLRLLSPSPMPVSQPVQQFFPLP